MRRSETIPRDPIAARSVEVLKRECSVGCNEALILGGLEAGTFFTGLIDDVRIYNRAVRS